MSESSNTVELTIQCQSESQYEATLERVKAVAGVAISINLTGRFVATQVLLSGQGDDDALKVRMVFDVAALETLPGNVIGAEAALLAVEHATRH